MKNKTLNQNRSKQFDYSMSDGAAVLCGRSHSRDTDNGGIRSSSGTGTDETATVQEGQGTLSPPSESEEEA